MLKTGILFKKTKVLVPSIIGVLGIKMNPDYIGCGRLPVLAWQLLVLLAAPC
jgi:hypothetical protein